jgi:LmbE family N-acetylglucosaminyl deacetylase
MTLEKYNALVIGAHMDDPEMGCGGTIPILNRLYEIYELILTDGSGGGDTNARMKESIAAAKVLDIKEVFFANQKDGRLDYYDATQIIEEYIKKIEPKLVITSSEHDNHQDHRTCRLATTSATRPHRVHFLYEILRYELPLTVTDGFSPHKFYDISETMKLKLRSIREHRSQIERKSLRPEDAKITANERGLRFGRRYVEAFELNHLLVTPDYPYW